MNSLKRIALFASAMTVLASLAACGDKAQELAGQPRQDAAPYTGTGVQVFTTSDWKTGDKNSWAQQLKTRAQYGQNDHSRSN
ncbi:MAG: hypothetical protein RL706_389 [Pseudomonadota bacterium]|jgi:hypothetical protein